MFNRIWLVLVAAAALAAFPQVQRPAEFEVASVRPNTANDRIVTINVGPGGRFAARGYTLVLLMQRAFGVMGWNIAGGPAWIHTDRYDVVANAPVAGNLTENQLKPMLQALLADRFKLRLHTGTKEMSGYALLPGRGGPKLKAAAAGEEQADTFRMTETGLSAQAITMGSFARYVAGKLGFVAVDQTGLKGIYDVQASWREDTDMETGGLSADELRDSRRARDFARFKTSLV